MDDKFFTQDNCDRCDNDLSGGRIMSMYNEDCICMDCKDRERNMSDEDLEALQLITSFISVT
jgi:hypothetical protein